MRLELIQGDITKIKADVIVNAANSDLLGGGGVDGAIHRAGGHAILEACVEIRNRHGKCSCGEAMITTAGLLPAKYVIHTVGPRWRAEKSGQDEELYHCYLNALKLADQHKAKSIAFPNISTGIYGYPKAEAAHIAWKAVNEYNAICIQKLYFVCFDDENYNLYQELINTNQI